MRVSKIKINNFRLLQESKLDFEQELCMLIGKNNSGKTSFLILLEKFYKNMKFDYNDFSLYLRQKLDDFSINSDIYELSIRLILEIEYGEDDNLSGISEFILDLDPKCNTVKILFECMLDKEKLLFDIENNKIIPKEKYIRKYISDYLDNKVYTFSEDSDLLSENRYKLVKKDLESVKKIIDFEIIHAKRSVSSSEENNSKKVLSALTTQYFNNKNKSNPDMFEEVNKLIIEMDISLADEYESFFEDFLLNSKEFLNLDDLRVVSNLKSKELVESSSEVIYGEDFNHLPEYLNGLGYMNILYLLLTIEIKKSSFKNKNKDIKLLYIEEPEAHTHPQLQCIFAKKIDDILGECTGLQTIITTHSPHIVSSCNFSNIRYLLKKGVKNNENIEIKNFYRELSKKYGNETEEFKFLKQYLTTEASELFFANKIIFIEGVSENILLPYFISEIDKENEKEKDYIPISSQNISVLQVGSNAKAFKYFLEFLEIKTLIITDIDTTKYIENTSGKTFSYKACAVADNPDAISNETIKYYLKSPDIKKKKSEFENWVKGVIKHSFDDELQNLKVYYQKLEKSYYPRSFEDAFICINNEKIKEYKETIQGLKNKELFDEKLDFYELTKRVINKKSDFASSILYLAYTKEIKWEIPLYIREGLEWLQK